MSVINFNKKDVFDFWEGFFPELKDTNDINKLLENFSDTSFDLLFDKYLQKDDFYKKFFANDTDEENDFISQTVIDEISDKIKWGNFFSPIIKYYSSTLLDIIRTSKILNDKTLLFVDLTAGIVKKLLSVANQILVLEINIAKNEGKLQGATPSERAVFFDKVLLKDVVYLKNIYSNYPELIRVLNLMVVNHIRYIKEIIDAVECKFEELSKIFDSDSDLGLLEKIQFNLGDTHNNGKSVAKLSFSGGQTVIFKPHKLDLELGYKKLIDWFNGNKIENFLTLKACKVIVGHNYGFMEYVQNVPCDSPENADKFNTRIGELLCLAYTLISSDLHYENLIAQNDQPILIDLEMLLGQGFPMLYEKELSATEKVAIFIRESVRQNVLLPTKIISTKNNKSIDIGAMREGGNMDSPFSSLVLNNTDSDEVQIIRGFEKVNLKSNRPIMNENNVKLNYYDEIKLGFKNMYNWICENKTEYIQLIQKLFSQCNCRILLKPTFTYSQILVTSFHPDLLQNEIDRFIYLHRIGLLLQFDSNEHFNKIFSSEIKDMQNADIPYFIAPFKSNYIISSNGEKISGIYKNSILEEIKDRISSMSQEDLMWQIALINSNKENNILDLTIEQDNSFDDSNLDAQQLRVQYLELCKNIGEYILNESFVGTVDARRTRAFIRKFPDSIHGFSLSDDYLLEGNSGIALFLFYLGKTFNISAFKDASFEVLNTILDSFDRIYRNKISPNKEKFCSIFEILYVIFKIGQESENRDLKIFVLERFELVQNFVTSRSNESIQYDLNAIINLLDLIYFDSSGLDLKEKIEKLIDILFETIKKHLNLIKYGKIEDFNILQGIVKLNNIGKEKEIAVLIKDYLACEQIEFINLNNSNVIYNLLLYRFYLLGSRYSNLVSVSEYELLIEKFKSHDLVKDISLNSFKNLVLLLKYSKILNDIYLANYCLGYLNNLFKNCRDKINHMINIKLSPIGLITGFSGVGMSFLEVFSDHNFTILSL